MQKKLFVHQQEIHPHPQECLPQMKIWNVTYTFQDGQIAPGKLSQAYQFGTQIVKVNGNFDDAFAKSLQAAEEPGSYTVNSVNPFRIEGQKTIPFRALEALNWEVPDWLVYPGGALGNISSCGKD